jgi:hypothetical protein
MSKLKTNKKSYRKIFKLFFLLFCLCINAISLHAQEQKPTCQNFSIGLNVGQYKNDFAVGVNITSPYFWEGITAIRLTASENTFEYLPIGKTEYERSPYYNLRLGLTLKSDSLC